jgi:hypothetical protein
MRSSKDFSNLITFIVICYVMLFLGLLIIDYLVVGVRWYWVIGTLLGAMIVLKFIVDLCSLRMYNMLMNYDLTIFDKIVRWNKRASIIAVTSALAVYSFTYIKYRIPDQIYIVLICAWLVGGFGYRLKEVIVQNYMNE